MRVEVTGHTAFFGRSIPLIPKEGLLGEKACGAIGKTAEVETVYED